MERKEDNDQLHSAAADRMYGENWPGLGERIAAPASGFSGSTQAIAPSDSCHGRDLAAGASNEDHARRWLFTDKIPPAGRKSGIWPKFTRPKGKPHRRVGPCSRRETGWHAPRHPPAFLERQPPGRSDPSRL